MPRYPRMRAINTKLATLSSTTKTVASFGMLGFLMGCVSKTLSDIMCSLQGIARLPELTGQYRVVFEYTRHSLLPVFFLYRRASRLPLRRGSERAQSQE